jgi:DNA-directed RNA polymerase subunit RPC12/RpoP
MDTTKPGALFRCPHCGHKSPAFHQVCPECGRPFQRDYIDVRIHPRDPDPVGVVTRRFWARVFILLVVVWAAIIACMWIYSVS